MQSRTYEFTVRLIGKGDTLESAWMNARENADLSELDASDAVDNEYPAEFICPNCQENCLPDANDTEDEDHRRWNCQGCGSSWDIEEEKTFQVHDEHGMELDKPKLWDFDKEA